MKVTNHKTINLLLVTLVLLVISQVIIYQKLVKLEERQVLSPVVYPYNYENGTEIKLEKTIVLLQGTASFYSKDGCLGCGETQTMANGEVFNEDAYTLAVGIKEWYQHKGKTYGIPTIPLNTEVIVKNLDNGKEVVAKVTDTGGFNNDTYKNRVADLSKGLAEAIELKTDKSVVQISLKVN